MNANRFVALLAGALALQALSPVQSSVADALRETSELVVHDFEYQENFFKQERHSSFRLLVEPIVHDDKLTPQEPITIQFFRIDREFRFRIELVQDESGLSILGSTERLKRDAVVIAGGFLASYSPILPIGFIMIDGQIKSNPVSPLRDDVLSGIVCLDEREVTLTTMIDFAGPGNNTIYSGSCLQAGPLILDDGSPFLISSEASTTLKRFANRSYVRSFLAKDDDGAIYLGITSPTTVGMLSRVLLEPVRQRFNIRLVDAIHLHGSANAGIAFRAAGETITIGAKANPQATMIIGEPSNVAD